MHLGSFQVSRGLNFRLCCYIQFSRVKALPCLTRSPPPGHSKADARLPSVSAVALVPNSALTQAFSFYEILVQMKST